MIIYDNLWYILLCVAMLLAVRIVNQLPGKADGKGLSEMFFLGFSLPALPHHSRNGEKSIEILVQHSSTFSKKIMAVLLWDIQISISRWFRQKCVVTSCHILSHFVTFCRLRATVLYAIRLPRIRSRQSSKPSKQSWKCWTSSRCPRSGVKNWIFETGSWGRPEFVVWIGLTFVVSCQKDDLHCSECPAHVLKYHWNILKQIKIGTQSSHDSKKTMFLIGVLETLSRSSEKSTWINMFSMVSGEEEAGEPCLSLWCNAQKTPPSLVALSERCGLVERLEQRAAAPAATPAVRTKWSHSELGAAKKTSGNPHGIHDTQEKMIIH